MKIKEYFRKKFHLRVARPYGVYNPDDTLDYRMNDKYGISYSFKRFNSKVWSSIYEYKNGRCVYMLFECPEEAEQYARDNFNSIEDIENYNDIIEEENKLYLKEKNKVIQVI